MIIKKETSRKNNNNNSNTKYSLFTTTLTTAMATSSSTSSSLSSSPNNSNHDLQYLKSNYEEISKNNHISKVDNNDDASSRNPSISSTTSSSSEYVEKRHASSPSPPPPVGSILNVESSAMGNFPKSMSALSTETVLATTSSSSLSSIIKEAKSISLRKVAIVCLISMFAGLCTLFAQGISLLLTYRRNFGNAPIPRSPSHGLIVARHDHHEMNDEFIIHEEADDSYNFKNYTFKAFYPKVISSHNQYHQQQQEPPLRLLVIGDSIARGVGQSHHCNPVFPQSLGKHLSMHLNNRAIYWTTMAEPGASTKSMSGLVGEAFNRLKKESKRQLHQNDHDVERGLSSTATRATLNEFKEMHTLINKPIDMITKEEWIEKLEYHKKLYAENPFGNYDIIFVMAGMNDVKRTLVPFMFGDEIGDKDEFDEEDFHDLNIKENKERGFAADMKKLINLLNRGHSLDYKMAHEEQQQQHNQPDRDQYTCETESHDTEETCLLSKHRQDLDEQPPLIVFPRFPVKVSPIKMGYFLRSSGNYLTGLMDEVKGRIANQYDNVMSTDTPSAQSGHDYLARTAQKTNISSTNSIRKLVSDEREVVVNLLDMACDECNQREQEMMNFYAQREAKDFCYEIPLMPLYAKDGLHPR